MPSKRRLLVQCDNALVFLNTPKYNKSQSYWWMLCGIGKCIGELRFIQYIYTNKYTIVKGKHCSRYENSKMDKKYIITLRKSIDFRVLVANYSCCL